MVTSTINKPILTRKQSTLPTITETAAISITDFFDSQNDTLICGYFLTTYNYWAPFEARKNNKTLVVNDAKPVMSERPFYVMYSKVI